MCSPLHLGPPHPRLLALPTSACPTPAMRGPLPHPPPGQTGRSSAGHTGRSRVGHTDRLATGRTRRPPVGHTGRLLVGQTTAAADSSQARSSSPQGEPRASGGEGSVGMFLRLSLCRTVPMRVVRAELFHRARRLVLRHSARSQQVTPLRAISRIRSLGIGQLVHGHDDRLAAFRGHFEGTAKKAGGWLFVDPCTRMVLRRRGGPQGFSQVLGWPCAQPRKSP